MMITARRMEFGLMAVLAITLTQMAFRPITQAMITAPFTFFTVPSATASIRPAFSATLVFTSAEAFDMEPANDGVLARGTGVYTISDTVAHISLRLTNLTPNAVYAIQCVRITSASGSTTDVNPCSLKNPTVTADWRGRAFFSIDRALLEGSSAETATALRLVLNNKDGGAPFTQLSYSFPVTESL
jgi:hypothetical protein